MRIIATIVSMIVLAVMAVPAYAQTPPTPTPDAMAGDAMRPWIIALQINSGSGTQESCGNQNDWFGFVRGGLMTGVATDDRNFPADLENYGGICYNIHTGELRAWLSRTARPSIRLYRIPSVNINEEQKNAYCDGDLVTNSARLSRQGVAYTHTDIHGETYTLYVAQLGVPANRDARFFDHYLMLVAAGDGGCRIRANTYFRDYDEFSPIAEDFNTPLHPAALLLYDNNLSDDGGFDEGFFGYIIWTMAALATLLVLFRLTKSTTWAFFGASFVSIFAIYMTDVPNFAIVFPALWMVLIVIVPFMRR